MSGRSKVLLRRLLLIAVVVAGVAACGRGPGAYFPFIPGGYWRYAVTVKTTQLVKSSKSTLVGLDPVSVDGRRLDSNRVNSDLIDYYESDGDWIRRVARQRAGSGTPKFEAEAVTVLPRRPEIGASWTDRSITAVLETTVDPFRRLYRIEEPFEIRFTVAALDDAVELPAGRFRNCMRVEGAGKTVFKGDKTVFGGDIEVRQTDWYAPGVGLVKSKRVESTTSKVLPQGEFLMELEIFEP